MTNLEAYKARTGSTLSDEAISGLLLSFGINPDEDWVYSESNPINCAFYGLLIQDKMNKAKVKSESEGGYSISYSTESLNAELYDLALESGCSSLIDKYGFESSVTDVSGLLSR